ncbi:MAG: DUF1566 domain-containing protein [Nitrospinae bacterium]|nr:DUF1566 domain-containing protein [Nitrospinota bacterium]
MKTENYTITIPRYIDNGNGTVTDTTTNLMWQKGQSSTTYDWYRASGTYHAGYNSNGVNVCGSLNLAGYSNWRLPSIDELKTIITGTTSPTIDTSVFTVDLYYMLFWSSTTATGVGYQDYVWSVDFNGGAGSIFYYNRGSYLSVRCVR